MFDNRSFFQVTLILENGKNILLCLLQKVFRKNLLHPTGCELSTHNVAQSTSLIIRTLFFMTSSESSSHLNCLLKFPDVSAKKHSLDSSSPQIRASPADLQLNPLKPRAVSGSPLRINQNPAKQDHNHTFIQVRIRF